MNSLIGGALLSATLILAIGAQNAYVLRQGLRGHHVFIICLICALSDVVLIAIGVYGFSTVATRLPWLRDVMLYAGITFLLWYGIKTGLAALKGGQTLEAAAQPGLDQGSGRREEGRSEAIWTVLAITWLNPHVYLDTLVFLGSVAAQYESPFLFALGASVISFVFFFALGYGAKQMAPWFANPRSWRILDGFVAVTMLALAVKLALGI